jgi:arylsulfatase A
MPTEEVTLAEMFKSAGYRTALFGKWHLGTTPECEPNGQGFDEFFGHKSGCIDNYSHFFYWQEPNIHDLWRNNKEVWEDGRHFSSLIVREAKDFIDRNKDKPFFLYLPFNTPHYPLQAPEKFRKMYENLSEPRRAYAASVSHLDACVGEILDFLEQSKLNKETIVIFQSDHGHSTEARANFGGGNAGPYRGSKFSVLEGGIRWRGILPENETRDQLAISMDWLPTLAQLTGVPLPGRRIDGKSLVTLLKDKTAGSPHDVLHWQLGNQWAVRQNEWKLISRGHDTKQGAKLSEELFLVNLTSDPSEKYKLAAENPEIVKKLTALHEAWARDVVVR